MLPSHILTALHVVELDVGRHLGIDQRIPVGVAILTAELRGTAVIFSLDSCILKPTDMAEKLLAWLGQHVIREGATITGYRLKAAITSLSSLPGGDDAPALRAMTACHRQYLLDLSASSAGRPASFREACEQMGIICAPAEPAKAFRDWVRGDVACIEGQARLDAIAAFRLLLQRLASINQVGRSIADAMSDQLRVWLEQADHPAARAHVADLLFSGA
ncbi:hypothetical protein GGQ80_001504 [Sphingomonas jinjuensis]|uniref:Uncharacterized protein n=1 Tax=Sphingomonas jinjuensis TaxID=535907 RepID=A0A840FAF1_9SPHN|nr:hypothetical protein [Sphingomonas jinjuensis]MBB4153602.1 hypothetical protein [Sphingomonas jinjuensis]